MSTSDLGRLALRLALLALLPWGCGLLRADEAPDASDILHTTVLPPTVPYSGEVSVVTWYGKRTRARELLVQFAPPQRFRREIVDRFGATAQVIVSDGKTEWFYDRAHRRVWKSVPADADYKILGPEEEFDLMAQNYATRVSGEETVAGRPCWILEIEREKDAHAVRRLWVDKEHGLILRANSFQTDGTLASTMRFVKVDFPRVVDDTLFRFEPPVGATVVKSPLKPGYMELEDARVASGIGPRHPRWLPSGYVFESVNVMPYKGSTFLHYRYSDGMDALSLFQCPSSVRLDFGDLPAEKVSVGSASGRLSFGPDGKILEWPGHGQRFVLVGSLPLDILRRVAESVQ